MKTTKKLLFIMMCFIITSNVSSQKYKKVWSDEFNKRGSLNSKKWDYEFGYVRNNELQYYTNEAKNIRQRKGNLEIIVVKEPQTFEGHKYGESASFDYTSGSVITLGKFDFTYGKIEGRFKVPVGKGLWTCFWMLGVSHHEIGWPKCGELDIFEHINNENMVHGTAHWADVNDKHTRKGGTFKDIDVTQWHVYSIEWTPEKVEWFVDGKKFHELDIKDGVNSTHEYHKPHYILINLPIGGSWPGSPDETTILPATLYCDYVRVYQLVDRKRKSIQKQTDSL